MSLQTSQHLKHGANARVAEHMRVCEWLREPTGNSSQLKCIRDQSFTKIRHLHAHMKYPVWSNLQLKWFQLHL